MKKANTQGWDQMDFVMYTKPDCPWCARAHALFDFFNSKVEYRFFECDEWPTYPAIYRVIGEDMELIGGFNELRTLVQKEGI